MLTICTLAGILVESVENQYAVSILFTGFRQGVKIAWKAAALFAVFIAALPLLFNKWDQLNIYSMSAKPQSESQFRPVRFFHAHIFACFFVIIFCAWLPFVIAVYPGLAMGDTTTQLAQFFNEEAYKPYLQLLNPDVKLNQHHPVLHTVILGAFVALGRVVGSWDVGLFAYVIFQSACLALSLSYALSYLQKKHVSPKILVALMLLFCIYPFYAQYAALISKDTLYSATTLALIITIVRILDSEKQPTVLWLGLILSAVGFCLLRNAVLLFCYWLELSFCCKEKSSPRLVAPV